MNRHKIIVHIDSSVQILPIPILLLRALSLTCVSPARDDAGLPVYVRLLFLIRKADRQNMAVEGETMPLSASHSDQGNVIIVAASPVVPVEDNPLHRQLSLKLILHSCMVVTYPQQVASHINTKPREKDMQYLDISTNRELDSCKSQLLWDSTHKLIKKCQLQDCGISSHRCDNASCYSHCLPCTILLSIEGVTTVVTGSCLSLFTFP